MLFTYQFIYAFECMDCVVIYHNMFDTLNSSDLSCVEISRDIKGRPGTLHVHSKATLR